jgi:hypothetical protein
LASGEGERIMTFFDPSSPDAPMDRDVDLLRLLLLDLATMQRSPPEGFVLPLDDMARRLQRRREELIDSLDLLLSLEFIEAPGRYHGEWLFRKLTRRGEWLASMVQDEEKWAQVKAAYGVFQPR